MSAQFWTHFRVPPGRVAHFPAVAGRSQSTDADGGNFVVALPDGIATGHRLIVVVGTQLRVGALTWPAGWTAINASNFASGRLEAFYRDVDGSEGFTGLNDTITVTTTVCPVAALAWRITDFAPATAPALGTLGSATSAAPDSGANNPGGWGTEDTLWLSVAGIDGGATVSAYPVNMPDGRRFVSIGDATTGFAIIAAERNLRIASFDPDPFTLGGSDAWRALTIAVRPSS